MKHILDLRQEKKEVHVIEKIIFKRHPWHRELMKVALSVVIVSIVVWGVSNADEKVVEQTSSEAPSSWSALGIVSTVGESSLSLSNGESFDLSSVAKIETAAYSPLSFSDIKEGDKIILQGTRDGDVKSVSRIISFSDREPATPIIEEVVATTTDAVATSTDETATTSDEIDITTEPEPEEEPSFIETVIDAVVDFIRGEDAPSPEPVSNDGPIE